MTGPVRRMGDYLLAMGSYSFKSSGKTASVITTETPTTTVIPYGIKTPLRYGVDTIYEVHTSLADQVADNFRNLILTNWGERLGLFNFGADLRPILSNFASLDDFDSAAMQRINSAVSMWMPYISLGDFTSSTDRTNNKSVVPIRLRITYSIPALEVKKRILELTMYAM